MTTAAPPSPMRYAGNYPDDTTHLGEMYLDGISPLRIGYVWWYQHTESWFLSKQPPSGTGVEQPWADMDMVCRLRQWEKQRI